MPNQYKPQFDYPIDEWIKHFEHFFRSPNGSHRDELLRYFHTEYPQSHSERCWKLNRCGTALAYLMRHLSDFEEFTVTHDGRALISAPIVLALWRYYGAIPTEYLDVDPKPDKILELAREEK